MKINYFASPFWVFGVIAALATPALADDVLTMRRLSAGLAAEAVTEAVAVCTKQGYKVTAAIVDKRRQTGNQRALVLAQVWLTPFHPRED